MVVDLIGNPGCGENIEGEILALRIIEAGVAVDPAEADTARNIRHESRAGLGEVVTKSERDAVVKVLRAAGDRLDHEDRVDLVIALEPAVALDASPAPAGREKLGGDLVAVWVPDNPHHV